MKVDIRNKIKKEKMMRELPNNHRNSFEQRLTNELHQKSGNYFTFLKIAASFLILLSLGVIGYQFFKSDAAQEIVLTEDKPAKKINSMADISPNLKKIEEYYLTHINYQFSKIKITDENRAFLDSYFIQLGKLQEDYNNSIAEINSEEISEETINALIENLQMRLKLMYQLKAQLKKKDNLKNQENESNKI
jgi:hypothetical protein